MRYTVIFQPEEGGDHPTAVNRIMFMDQLDREGAATILKHLQASDASMRVAQLRVLGGAMARVSDDATAFAHRQSRIMVNLVALYREVEERAVCRAWIAEFAAALDQGNTSAYVKPEYSAYAGVYTRRRGSGRGSRTKLIRVAIWS